MNVESLEVIQTALFAVSLDEGRPTDLEEVARACLHGDGRNKWFDKPFNLIIFANGRGGINGEHAWADAIVVVNAFSRVLAKTNEEFRVAFESGGQLSSTL